MPIAKQRLVRSVLAASVVALSTRAYGQQAPSSAGQTPTSGFRSPSAADDSLYSSAESDFVVGKTVFLRSSKMRYGIVLAVDANHRFPRSFGKTQMKAVLIRRKDGPYEWTPVERVVRIYVVNKS